MAKGDEENKENGVNKRLDANISTNVSIPLDKGKLEELRIRQQINRLTDIGFSNPEVARILTISVESVESQERRKRGGESE